MNTTVTASGMQVTAKSNSFFLQIVNSGGTFSNTESQNSATATTASKEVYPTTVGSAFSDTTVTVLTGSEKTIDALKWATAHSNDPASSTKVGNYTDVSTSANAIDGSNVYTLINTFKVRLNPDAGTGTATNLKVTNANVTAATENASMLSAVRVLVMAGDGVTVFDSNGDFVEGASNGIIQSSVTTDDSIVTVYVFFDGDDESVKTNNILTSEGYNVSFDLTVTPGT